MKTFNIDGNLVSTPSDYAFELVNVDSLLSRKELENKKRDTEVQNLVYHFDRFQDWIEELSKKYEGVNYVILNSENVKRNLGYDKTLIRLLKNKTWAISHLKDEDLVVISAQINDAKNEIGKNEFVLFDELLRGISGVSVKYQ